MRYLGVDYGSKRVGLALSDENGTMGFPHSIVANTPRFVDDLRELIEQEHVGAIVIGESKTLGGVDNAIMKEARALGDTLARSVNIPVVYESEVFTTTEARRQHVPEAKSRRRRERVAVDASAAALILTSYLSRTHHD